MGNKRSLTGISKFLSFILRHNPKAIGVHMDSNGYVSVDHLIKNMMIDRKTLEEIVRTDSKQRYSFNDDKTKIRANQGHSVNVDLKLKPATPPEFLFHGTTFRSYRNIIDEGIKRMNRHHVHLSSDEETAWKVANRRQGISVVLRIVAKEMDEAGYKFYKSANGVWLTYHVPAEFIETYDERDESWENICKGPSLKTLEQMYEELSTARGEWHDSLNDYEGSALFWADMFHIYDQTSGSEVDTINGWNLTDEQYQKYKHYKEFKRMFVGGDYIHHIYLTKQ